MLCFFCGCCDVASRLSAKQDRALAGAALHEAVGISFARSLPSAESGLGSVLERLLALHHTACLVLNELREGVLYGRRYSVDWLGA